jgi:hypothetical protein
VPSPLHDIKPYAYAQISGDPIQSRVLCHAQDQILRPDRHAAGQNEPQTTSPKARPTRLPSCSSAFCLRRVFHKPSIFLLRLTFSCLYAQSRYSPSDLSACMTCSIKSQLLARLKHPAYERLAEISLIIDENHCSGRHRSYLIVSSEFSPS